MIRDIIYQISVFGDITPIQPNADTIQSMINKFSAYNLLPSVFLEGSLISPLAELSNSETLERLRMSSVSKRIDVVYARNRIDVSKAAIDLSIGVSSPDLIELYDIVVKAVEGMSFTRIAFNTTSLLSNPISTLSQKIQPRLAYYDAADELMLRINKRNDISFGEDLCEKSNIILTAQKTMGQLLVSNQPIMLDNGLVLQFDINTTPELFEPRFFANQINSYVKAAEDVRQDLLSDLVSD